MMKLAVVFVGGGLGSVLRYAMGLLVAKFTPSSSLTGSSAAETATGTTPHWLAMYPIATMSVNIIGCALIGFIWGMLGDPEEGNEPLRLALIVGLLGGFTTFSSFGWETLDLMSNGRTASAIGYVLISVALGLLAAWGGHAIATLISGS